MPENAYILGIDLGTTNSVISFWNDSLKKVEPIDISNGFGKIPMPSIVQYREDSNEWIIGNEAARTIKLYPETTISSIKSKMGQNYKIKLANKDYKPEEISAKIILELINSIYNINPNAEVYGIVLSIPYDFSDAAKKDTIKAIEIAGLDDKLICMIEEPKAAALSYNYHQELNIGEKILIFDFGGGTLDITIFNVENKTDSLIKLKILSLGGSANHGGDNIDDILQNHFLNILKEKTKEDIENIDIENLVEIQIKAKESKERLSGIKNFRIPFHFCNPPFAESINREDFEILISKFIKKTSMLVKDTLKNSYIGEILPYDISKIILDGGSSSMPWVKNILIDIFGDGNKIYSSEKPALDISIGAAYYAAIKMGRLNSRDIESYSENIEFELSIPHDIGIVASNNGKKVFFPILKRGTPYSLAKKSHIFTLSGENEEDMQQFELKILERIGKNDSLDDCKLVGEIIINDLPKRPKGKTRIELLLIYKENEGIIEGRIKDLGFFQEFEASGYERTFIPKIK